MSQMTCYSYAEIRLNRKIRMQNKDDSEEQGIIKEISGISEENVTNDMSSPRWNWLVTRKQRRPCSANNNLRELAAFTQQAFTCPFLCGTG